MKHSWIKQPAGDVKCSVCGGHALIPNDKECFGDQSRTADATTGPQRSKPCCGGTTKARDPNTRDSKTTSITRRSCIECVEKHLGAALVLLGECRYGYTYRLRVIGHLHEAEDESQEWSPLHEAIREARKAYQKDGKIPDFDQLAVLLATRASGHNQSTT